MLDQHKIVDFSPSTFTCFSVTATEKASQQHVTTTTVFHCGYGEVRLSGECNVFLAPRPICSVLVLF